VAGLKAVIELTQEPVEDVTQCGGVPVTVCSTPVILVFDRARSRIAAKAQTNPTAASLFFSTCRWVTQVLRPDARVTGAEPANALSPRASANRPRSSPISAKTRAPVASPSPGKLVMISKSGCRCGCVDAFGD